MPPFLHRLPHLVVAFTLAVSIAASQALAQSDDDGSAAPVNAEASATTATANVPALTATDSKPPPELHSEFKPLSLLTESIWSRLRDKFEFSQIENARVDEQLEFLSAGVPTLSRNFERASPYLFHISEQLERAGVPLDIALLPLIESAFDPHALSHKSAMGLWQFIPSTANHYGLTIEKHYDQRKDVLASTNAAVRLLSDLHRMFDGDWLLALAAYNTGPTNVRNAMERAVKKGITPDYWNLKLSKETSNYVPRLIAATKLVSDPDHYGLILPPLANRKQIESVSVGRRISLQQVADLTTLSFEEVKNLNPGLHRDLTPLNGPHRLILPVDAASQLLEELKNFKRQPLVNQQSQIAMVSRENSDHGPPGYLTQYYETHTISPGDTLWDLSRKAGVDVDTLRAWNNLEEKDTIRAGDSLYIAYNFDSPESAGLMNYRVAPNESLSIIAERFDLEIDDIKRWNRSLRDENHIQAGQLLRIPSYPSDKKYRP